MCLFIYVESIIFIGRLSVGWGIIVTLYILGFSLKEPIEENISLTTVFDRKQVQNTKRSSY